MFDFPASPSTGTIYSPAGGPQYLYDGQKWKVLGSGKTAQARNRICNPCMAISQENGDTQGHANGGDYYAADQWKTAYPHNSAAFPSQRVQVVTPNGSSNRYRVIVSTADAALAAGDYLQISQAIEGNMVADFRWGTASGKQAVLRFGWKSPAGTYSVSLTQGTTGNPSYMAQFTVSAAQANIDTEQVIVIPPTALGTWPTTTNAAFALRFIIAAGSNFQGATGWSAAVNVFGAASNTNGMATASAIYELFDVALYLDPDATGLPPPFQVPAYDDDLRACQRYWEKTIVVTSAAANSQNTNNFLTAKRVPPTLGVTLGGGTGATFAMTGDPNNAQFYQATVHSVGTTATITGNARM